MKIYEARYERCFKCNEEYKCAVKMKKIQIFVRWKAKRLKIKSLKIDYFWDAVCLCKYYSLVYIYVSYQNYANCATFQKFSKSNGKKKKILRVDWSFLAKIVRLIYIKNNWRLSCDFLRKH